MRAPQGTVPVLEPVTGHGSSATDRPARDDIEVLTPNVRTSGGATWNVAAIEGASHAAAQIAATSEVRSAVHR